MAENDLKLRFLTIKLALSDPELTYLIQKLPKMALFTPEFYISAAKSETSLKLPCI